MKKSIFMIAASALVLTACSSEETLEVNNGRAIQFRHEMTRATETTTNNLLSFVAAAETEKGEQYFVDETFSRRDANTKTFTNGTEYYWPGDGSTLTFSAYAPADLTGVTQNKTTKKLTGFSPASDIAKQVDFITGTGEGSRANEVNGAEIEFKHNLAQIEIQAKTGNTNYTYKISGVKIANPVSKGDFTFGGNWTLDKNEKAVYTIEYDAENVITLNTTAQSLMDGKGNAMLIPQTLDTWEPDAAAQNHNTNKGAYIAVKLEITRAGVTVFPFTEKKTVDGTEVTKVSEWAAIPVSTIWEAGKKYTYVLDFTSGAGYVVPEGPVDPDKPILGGPIKFTVNVTAWDAQDDIEQSMKVPAEENGGTQGGNTEGE